MRNFLALMATLALFACNANDGQDAQKPPIDSEVDSAIPTPDVALTTPDAGLTPDTAAIPACEYPNGPYGTAEGKTVANMVFDAFADPEYLCKETQEMTTHNTATRKISFKDFYCNSPCKDKQRQVLWVIVSAGWCQPCRSEVAATQTEYAKGAVDKRVHVMNILYEDEKAKPITEDFARLWTQNNLFELTFPVALDPAFTMGKYFNRDAVPFNMLVDLRTMKIIYRQTGGELTTVGAALSRFLNSSSQ